MEEDVIRFLKKAVWTISSALLWLFINMVVAIHQGWMVPRHHLGWQHFVFYVWALLSLFFVIRFNYKLWKIGRAHV